MEYPCFLVERVNERRQSTRLCGDPDCHDEHVDYLFDLQRADTGEIIIRDLDYMPHHGLPAGAMWFEDIDVGKVYVGPDDWSTNTELEIELAKDNFLTHPEWYPNGADPVTGLPHKRPSGIFASGPHLIVQTPGGQWNIDSRASNCTMPWDYEHRCWVRTGEPPNVTAGKDGPTCSAGAGSIQAGDYHGFLRDGKLVP